LRPLLLAVHPQCVYDVDAHGNTALHYVCRKSRHSYRYQEGTSLYNTLEEGTSTCNSPLDETILIIDLLLKAGLNPHHLNSIWDRAVDLLTMVFYDHHDAEEYHILKNVLQEPMRSSQWIMRRLLNFFLLAFKVMRPCLGNCMNALFLIVCCPILCPWFAGCMAWNYCCQEMPCFRE